MSRRQAGGLRHNHRQSACPTKRTLLRAVQSEKPQVSKKQEPALQRWERRIYKGASIVWIQRRSATRCRRTMSTGSSSFTNRRAAPCRAIRSMAGWRGKESRQSVETASRGPAPRRQAKARIQRGRGCLSHKKDRLLGARGSEKRSCATRWERPERGGYECTTGMEADPYSLPAFTVATGTSFR